MVLSRMPPGGNTSSDASMVGSSCRVAAAAAAARTAASVTSWLAISRVATSTVAAAELIPASTGRVRIEWFVRMTRV